MKFRKLYTIQELAILMNAEIKGDKSFVVNSIECLSKAGSRDCSFLTNISYVRELESSKAGVIIVPKSKTFCTQANLLIVKDVRAALARLLTDAFRETDTYFGIHESAIIGKDCEIPEDTYIGPNVVIGDNVKLGYNVHLHSGVNIGSNCHIDKYSVIYANVVIYPNCYLGKKVVIHANTTIGSAGFGYTKDGNTWIHLKHVGSVKIGHNVEIGSQTSIDRGVIDDTIIGDHVIIDNQVQVGHNVEIGNGTAIAGCVGIAGSTKIGKNCLIGGQVGIAGHIQIADNVIVTAGSGVNHSLKKSGVYSSGIPAKEQRQWQRNVARLHNLDNLAKQLKILEKKYGKEGEPNGSH